MPSLSFVEPNGTLHNVEVAVGMTFLQAARAHSIDLEAACGGSLSCATCHLVVDPAWYDKLPPPKEDEEAILDVAFDITRTSRLGCQLRMTAELDGCVVTIAAENESLLRSPSAVDAVPIEVSSTLS